MDNVQQCLQRLMIFVVIVFVSACTNEPDTIPIDDEPERIGRTTEDLMVDPVTGIPYAFTFQFPIAGFDTSDFGFGFGDVNSNFCLANSSAGCTAYGAHTGRDTVVGKTPFGTEVLAPADGIVRLTTNYTYGAYGSDASSNPHYRGCLLLLEHEFPNGQPILTLLGHVQCESGAPYDPVAKKGNPSIGTIVRRGQYVAHVAHYWHGAGQTIDWHHLHWGMRRGNFSATTLSDGVRGYVLQSEFTTDAETHALTHDEWLDPFVIIAANGDPALDATNDVRHHPSGTLLEDSSGGYWLVTDERTISNISSDVITSDRYDVTTAVRVSNNELDCYSKGSPIQSMGRVTLYQRPGSSTVVMAYDATMSRYDVIRWEALLSWGFGSDDLTSDLTKIMNAEWTYADRGMRTMRPGSLVKAEDASEVAQVTMQGTRIPISSGDVFEDMGFAWQRVVSLPGSVLDVVAGSRATPIIDGTSIRTCLVPPVCPNGGTCGGGGVPDVDAGAPASENCNGVDDDGNGQVDEIFMCSLDSMDGPTCISSCNTAGSRICEFPSCTWGACMPFVEGCNNTIDDDCNGMTDCEDPACTTSLDCRSASDADGASAQVRLQYVGAPTSGGITLRAWWQPPTGEPRRWDTVDECIDFTSSDSAFDCTFSLPHSTTSFEFQVELATGAFWGDQSCDPLGGCGQNIGTVTLTADGSALVYTLIPNNTDSQPYMNGLVSFIP